MLSSTAAGLAEPAPSAAPRPRQRTGFALRLGVFGALAMFAGLTLVWLLAVPPFTPGDESAHVDYAVRVSRGQLPVAGPRITPLFPGQVAVPQHVANHPPLYYALSGPILRASLASGHPIDGVLAVRVLGLLLSLGTVLLAAVLAGRVAARSSGPARAQLMVAAAGLVAGLPSLVAASGTVENDALTIVLAIAVLAVLAGVVRAGATAGRVAALAIGCTAGMLARATFLQIVLVVVGTLAVCALRGRSRPIRGRLFAAALQVGTVLAAVLVGAGWFYRLNDRRYGDFDGGSVVYHLVSNRPLLPGGTGIGRFLVTPWEWWIQLAQLAGGPVGMFDHQPRHAIYAAIALGALFGAAVIALGAAVARGTRWRDRDGWLTLGGLVAVLVISILEIAQHVTDKGTPNNRYLLEAAGFWGVGAGTALLALGGRRRPVALLAVVAIEAVSAIGFTLDVAHRQHDLYDGHGWFDTLSSSMAGNGVGPAAPVLVLLLAVVLAGLAAQAVALVRLGRGEDPAARHP